MAPKRLSISELKEKLRTAGFPEQDIPTMAAITMAESAGNPQAYNPNVNTGDNSYGLLQVNMLGQMGADRRAKYGLESNEDLYDPATNLRVAKGIYDSQGLGAWGAYTNQSYKDFLPEALESNGQANTQQPETPPGLQLPENSVFIENINIQPYKEEKKKAGFTFKDYMKRQLLNSVLNPMAGMNFLGGYTSSNPSLAGMKDGTIDNLFGL